MICKIQILALLLVGSWEICHGWDLPQEYPRVENILTQDGQVVSNAINKFGFDVYKNLAETKGNKIFSPFSMSLALALLYYMTDGACAKEITQALSITENLEKTGQGFVNILQPSHNSSVDIGNKAYVDHSFRLKELYLDNIKNYLSADSEAIGFSDPNNARNHMNSWVSDKTHGKIPELFKEGVITTDTRIVLVNTLYFKNLWHYQFKPNDTKPLPFYLEDGTEKQVPMMKVEADLGFAEIPSLKSKVLVLPYKGGKQNLMIILPNERNGLSNLENSLTNEVFNSVILPSIVYGSSVRALIPKFNMDFTLSLVESWKQMGIKSVFDFTTANFSRAVANGFGLEVSEVIHRACIEIDEQGTVAAAATAVLITTRSSHSIPYMPLFRADHPFLFALTDSQTNVIMFLGRYVSP